MKRRKAYQNGEADASRGSEHLAAEQHAGVKPRLLTPATGSVGPAHAVGIAAAFNFTFFLILWRIYWVPAPLSANASPLLFSEARALQHVHKLAGEIGERQVSTAQLDLSADYLFQTATQLAQQAQQCSDLLVQVRREQVSGGVLMALLGLDMANVYQNLTNIVMTLTPKRHQDIPAVLVNAHYDTAVGSPGASDCTSPVGVMLETARLLIANPQIQLAGPVVFLFNGAEETLSQAAHGFMAHDRQAGQVGAFINLESTGPGGPDILFQASGGWTTDVYATAAPHARGQVFGQDLMDSQIIPADTDYRMFSYKYYGSLPGIDIAFLLDSSAYHTHQDAPHRIRPGTLQAMGENVVGAIPAFAQHLSEAAAQNLPPDSSATSDSVYFDLCGLWMISFKASAAKWLHNTFLPLLLLAPPPGVQRGAMAKAAGTCVLSMLSCLALPAAVGGLRAFLSGQQLIWFSNHLAGALMYIPAALAGALLPFRGALGQGRKQGQEQGQGQGAILSTQVAGSCLFNAVAAAILTAVGGKVAYAHFLWGTAAYISLWVVSKVDSVQGLFAVLICAIVPATSNLTGILLLATHLMEKMSMTGAPPNALLWGPDAIMGALFGAGTFVYLGYGCMMAWLVHCLGQTFKWVCRALMFLSIASAVVASITLDTYTAETPKRLFLQHIIRGGDSSSQSAVYAAASSDATPVDVVFQNLNLHPAESNGQEWLAMYPMTDMIRGKVFAAPPPDKHIFPASPYIQLVSRDSAHSCLPGRMDRLHLELKLPMPGVGVMNVTGPLEAWSFTDQLPTSFQHKQPSQYIVRYGGNVGSETWPFWLDIQCGQKVTVSIAASFLMKTSELNSFLQHIPDWVAISATTTFQSSWSF